MRKVSRVLTLLAMALAVPTTAQDKSENGVATLEPSSPWNLDYAEWNCSIKRAYRNGDQQVLFSFRREPLVAKNWLYIFFADEKGKRDHDDAKLSIDGQTVGDDLHYNIFDAPGYRIRQVWIDLDKIPLDQTKSHLKLELARHGTIEIPVPDFQDAWQALDACMTDLYKAFDVDMTAQEAMAVEPKGRIFDAFESPSKPADFAFFYWVNEEGRVDDCRLVMPSGIESFDTRLCDEIMKNGKFEPALDKDGNPIRVARFENLRLRISVQRIG